MLRKMLLLKYMITDLGLDSSLSNQFEFKLLINMWMLPLEKSHHGRTYVVLAMSEAFCN